jgi:hypothetical protein
MDICVRGTRNCEACYFESTLERTAPAATTKQAPLSGRWDDCAAKYSPAPSGDLGSEDKPSAGKLIGFEAWICPKCGAVWAWYVRGCERCNGIKDEG